MTNVKDKAESLEHPGLDIPTFGIGISLA